MRWLEWCHPLNGHEFEQPLGDCEGWGKPGVLQSISLQRVKHDLTTEQQQQQKMKKIFTIYPHLYCFLLLHTFCSLGILDILWIHLSGLPYCL